MICAKTWGTERGREQRPQILYRVQFRSALPIRQALIRLQQIANNYDRMPPEQKQAIDQKAAQLLSGRFAETVVAHVAYSSNVAVNDREMAQYWQRQTTETLKNFVFLISPKGDKIPLLRYTVSQGASREFQLIFPRQYEGRPLLSPQDKTLKLEFVHPRITGPIESRAVQPESRSNNVQNESRVLLEFKVDKMVLQGEVVY